MGDPTHIQRNNDTLTTQQLSDNYSINEPCLRQLSTTSYSEGSQIKGSKHRSEKEKQAKGNL